jgi:hypothetical protein
MAHSALVTTAMPASSVLFGDFSQVVLPTWGTLEIGANPYQAVGRRALLRCRRCCGAAARQLRKIYERDLMKVRFIQGTRVDGQDRSFGQVADVSWQLAAALIQSRLAVPADSTPWDSQRQERTSWVTRWRT